VVYLGRGVESRRNKTNDFRRVSDRFWRLGMGVRAVGRGPIDRFCFLLLEAPRQRKGGD
jgi:hypothetical protein